MKARIVRWFVLVSLVLLGLGAGGGPAQAMYIGSPTPALKKGNMAVGASLSDYRTTVFGDYGLSDAGTLEVQLSGVDFGGGVKGTEVGASYRHKLGQSFKLGDYPVHLGVMGSYHLGHESTLGFTLSSSVLQVGVGGSMTPVKKLELYATAIFERVTADTVVPFFGKVSASETNLGVNLGASYAITDQFSAGAELHPGLNDDGAAIYASYRF